MAIRRRHACTRTWPSYWTARLTARHFLGQDRAALKEVRHALALYPDDRLLQFMEIRALAALGRIEEAEQTAQRLAARGDPQVPEIEAYVVLANELAVHGHRAAARRMRVRALEAPVPPRAGRLGGSNVRAQLLIAAGKHQDALRITARKLQSDSSIGARALHAMASAGIGDTATALVIMKGLEQIRPRYSHGLPAYWRAAIAAQLGRREEAVTLLRQALDEGYLVDLRMHATPLFAPLWSYAPYRALMEPQ